jgi:predicted metal-dependent enzyme (double-stranded beta helix superfamily)
VEDKMPARRLATLNRMIEELRTIWSEESDPGTRMHNARTVLDRVLADSKLRAHSQSWPSTVGQNLLFYEDPDFGFAINATVRPSGSVGTIHDHAHSWTLYGILDGTEQLERYERVDDGSRMGYAELKLLTDTTMAPGMVDFVAPYEIHAERGGDGRSVAVIIRSERLVGRVLQRGFDPKAHTVWEMSGPTQVPFELVTAE